MTAYYLDSSAGAKLYVSERGSGWITGLVTANREHQLFALRLMEIEVGAALFRRVRAGSVSRNDAVAATHALRTDFTDLFAVVEVSPAIVSLALGVAERHGLRGYDCVHLAAIVAIQQSRLAAGLDALQVICADQELNLAIDSEGLAVLDPNSYE